MSVPTQATYTAAALIPAHTGLLAQINGGSLKLRDANDALLATLALGNPAGSVNGATGVLTLLAASGAVTAGGSAAYGEICDPGGAVLLALPASSSSVAVPGRLAINSTTLIAGAAVNLLPSTLG
jgi:hypothetical protein